MEERLPNLSLLEGYCNFISVELQYLAATLIIITLIHKM